MRRSLSVLLVVPLLLVLAACAPSRHVVLPVKHHPSASASASARVSASPTPSAIAKAPTTPPVINPADYLIGGTPNVPDANGEWYGQWAFFTDSTKRVWCEFDIYNDDGPGAHCYIVPSATSQATYTIPPGASNNCDESSSMAVDGYALGLGLALQGADTPAESGWAGCANDFYEDPASLAKSKVLPDGATLAVAPFTCTVASAVATCTLNDTYSGKQPSITLGLHVASFAQP
jgi:hypothetical protein